jgi:hypothetical protein
MDPSSKTDRSSIEPWKTGKPAPSFTIRWKSTEIPIPAGVATNQISDKNLHQRGGVKRDLDAHHAQQTGLSKK